VLNGLQDRVEVSSNTLQVAERSIGRRRPPPTDRQLRALPSVSADGSANRASTPARGTVPASLGNTFGAVWRPPGNSISGVRYAAARKPAGRQRRPARPT